MRCLVFIIFFILFSESVSGQDESSVEKGEVSYITSQNIYVRFGSTENIAVGDTLFIKREGKLIPALLVNNKSSISCVCTAFIDEKINVSDEVFFRIAEKEEEEENTEEPSEEKTEVSPEEKPEVAARENAAVGSPEEERFEQDIGGRLSVGSYSNFSGSRTSHRLRYTFSMRGNYLKDSRLSFESYLTFRHTLDEWEEVRNHLGNALKIYSLAVKYEFNNDASLSLGRKINPRISSMGAIDGLQFEKRMGKFVAGAIAGTRPDYRDYGLNFHLFEAGAYIGHVSQNKQSYFQSTLALIDQRNHGKIDRRFVHFQHSGNPVQNLSVFGSIELDLYKTVEGKAGNTLSLTNLYALVRYRFSRKLSTTISYDNRKNVIYFETYKNYADSLIENETRQGLRLNVSYRLFKFLTWGVNASWRFQKDNGNLSRNLNTYFYFSRIPVLKISATITGNYLQTNYLDSRMAGIRLSKELVPGKFSGDLYFRMADFKYKNFDYNTRQYITGINFSYRLTRKLGVYLFYEVILNDRNEMYNRINTRVIQRF